MKRVVLVTCLVLLPVPVLALQLFTFDTVEPEAGTDGSEFVFARLVYSSGLENFWGFGRGSWMTDWPKADKQFIFGVNRMSNVRVVLDEDVAVEITDPKLFSYPFIYAVEVGRMELSQAEADRLREYMLRGGFLVVDDFWGTYEWQSFHRQMKKIFPDKEAEPIALSHPIFHVFFDIDDILQVPNYRNGCRGGRTSEQDGYVPYALAVFDDERRPMMVISYNSDLGDAWEWADLPCYPHEFSGFAYRMGINFIIYSMTH